MESDLSIRRAMPQDLPVMVDLLAELFTLESDFEVCRSKQESGLALLLQCSEALVLVAEKCGEIIGMCTVQTVISTAEGGPVGWLEDLIIKNGCRRLGAGKALITAAQEWASGRGLTRLQLLVEADNQAALAFYQRQGWSCTSLVCRRWKNENEVEEKGR